MTGLNQFKNGAILIGGLLLAAACGEEPAQVLGREDGPRGVLLISVDSLRADHLSCYGYKSALKPDLLTSPNIDQRLADQGLLFERAVSTTSWTVPAHMAMLSGQPNDIHGVVGPSSQLHESRPLIAQQFKSSGWRTAGFYSGPNLHPFFGFGRGFERYDDCTSIGVDSSKFGPTNDKQRDLLRAMEHKAHQGHTAEKVVDNFTDWFDGVEQDDRFFAFVHFWDVHYDYDPPAEFDLFDPDYTGDVDGREIQDLVAGRLPDRERDIQHVEALYDGEILYTDANVAKLLDALDAAGRLDNTLVVFVSDHGDEFADHGRFGHNKTLYEEVIHVPLILRYPGLIPAATRNDTLVSLVDLAPTILDLCGLAADPTHWGRSLTPLLEEGGELANRPAPLELIFGRPFRGQKRMPMKGMHAGTYKVIRNGSAQLPVVFDLVEDPGEQNQLDVVGTDARVRRARQLWKQIQVAAEDLPRTEGELPPELQDDLRAVGYLGDEE